MTQKTVIALGFFDGVHLGHRRILSECVRLAHELDAEPIAVTFDRQPRAFLNNIRPNLLMTNEDRVRAIAEIGVARSELLTFDYAMASMRPETFVRDLLVGRFGAAAVVCGFNYSFGAMGKGDGALLRDMAEPLHYLARIVPPVLHEGTAVSSTWIRRLIEGGEIALADTLLGRPWRIAGEVVHGRGVGRGLGFPTGNIRLDPDLVTPAYGVYAARAVIDGVEYACALNVGVRPTFDLSEPVAEFHVIDFDGDLYGRCVALELIDFVREERAFATVEELRMQVRADIEQIRESLR